MARRRLAELDWLRGNIRDLRAKYEEAYRIEGLENCTWHGVDDRDRVIACLLHAPQRPVRGNCAIFYFHGGGWIVGSPRTHADISQRLCERTGMRVISIDYRLSPEHPAPAPIEDGLAVLRYFLSHPSGCDSAVLCGDSAGGAIALAAERAADPTLRSRISGVASLYGGFGIIGSPSQRSWGHRQDGLDTDCIERMWVLANVAGVPSPYSVVSLAQPSNVPVYLMAAERDPLLDDSLALAKALEAVGRRIVLDVVEAEGHGFLHAIPDSPRAAAAMNRLCSWIAHSCRTMES